MSIAIFDRASRTRIRCVFDTGVLRTADDFTEPSRGLWEGQRMDEPFASGLRNIRRAIESRLKDSGIEGLTLGDTSRGCVRSVPGMVIIDVGGNDRKARVTFTRDEVEDCCRCVDTYCVRSKINHVVDELLS
jgi:hypothetical protein